jgi:hypothetical protein
MLWPLLDRRHRRPAPASKYMRRWAERSRAEQESGREDRQKGEASEGEREYEARCVAAYPVWSGSAGGAESESGLRRSGLVVDVASCDRSSARRSSVTVDVSIVTSGSSSFVLGDADDVDGSRVWTIVEFNFFCAYVENIIWATSRFPFQVRWTNPLTDLWLTLACFVGRDEAGTGTGAGDPYRNRQRCPGSRAVPARRPQVTC